MHPPERRATLRFAVKLPARIITPDGNSHPATIRDISSSGMLLDVALSSTPHIVPNEARLLPRLPVEFWLIFDTGNIDEELPVRVKCGLIHVRRTRSEECRMGVEFREFADHSLPLLARFWERIQMYAENRSGETPDHDEAWHPQDLR